MFTSCIILNDDMKLFSETGSEPCAPVRDHAGPLTNAPDTRSSLPSAPCLLDEKSTDLNFMPFRLRHKNMCVTSARDTQTLMMVACINQRRVGQFMQVDIAMIDVHVSVD